MIQIRGIINFSSKYYSAHVLQQFYNEIIKQAKKDHITMTLETCEDGIEGNWLSNNDDDKYIIKTNVIIDLYDNIDCDEHNIKHFIKHHVNYYLRSLTLQYNYIDITDIVTIPYNEYESSELNDISEEQEKSETEHNEKNFVEKKSLKRTIFILKDEDE